MSSDPECRFGHTFEVNQWKGSDDESEARDKIKSGEITSYQELLEEIGQGDAKVGNLVPVMGDTFKTVKCKSGTQGTPYTFILAAADDFSTGLGWEVKKTMEQVFVSPESNFSQEVGQRRQQAQQNIKSTMQNLSEMKKQKQMLEHDIRKLRSRAEAIRESGNDEVQLKADFIELVDGAGAGGQQGGDEAALKFYRDNNIYPSIVADFQEMRGLDDLKEPEESEFDDPQLKDLPQNEKAILKKKYTMYEKWKDLYGSEVQRKLKELKEQLHSTERIIQETKEWLEPYARDLVMMNQKSQGELAEDLNRYMTFRGYSTQFKLIDFVCYKPLKKEDRNLAETDNPKEATHYKVVYIFAAHVNISGGEQPQSPAEGPTVAKVQWYPAIVCKHVFDNIFQEKINRNQNRFEQLVEDYTGEGLETEQGEEFREEREEVGSVREFREKVNQTLEENGESKVEVEFSSQVRRIEDGFEPPESIQEKYDEEVMNAVNQVLETSYGETEGNKEPEGVQKLNPLKGIDSSLKQKWVKLTGQYNKYDLDDVDNDPIDQLKYEVKFDYYIDHKKNFGMFTMK
ncbi:MAG: hypothetical protein ABEJ83_04860 [Candidatus Nanohaloarchaea archaeon]